MEKLLYLILNKEDGKNLKEIFRNMKPMDAFYGFVDKCIKKYDYKMGLKDKICHSDEKPEICKATIKVEYDDAAVGGAAILICGKKLEQL